MLVYCIKIYLLLLSNKYSCIYILFEKCTYVYINIQLYVQFKDYKM